MNIKVYTGRVLAICTITGFALGSALVLGYRSAEEDLRELGPKTIVLKELENVETQLRWYLLSTDLVLRGPGCGAAPLLANESTRHLLSLRVTWPGSSTVSV